MNFHEVFVWVKVVHFEIIYVIHCKFGSYHEWVLGWMYVGFSREKKKKRGGGGGLGVFTNFGANTFCVASCGIFI